MTDITERLAEAERAVLGATSIAAALDVSASRAIQRPGRVRTPADVALMPSATPVRPTPRPCPHPTPARRRPSQLRSAFHRSALALAASASAEVVERAHGTLDGRLA